MGRVALWLKGAAAVPVKGADPKVPILLSVLRLAWLICCSGEVDCEGALVVGSKKLENKIAPKAQLNTQKWVSVFLKAFFIITPIPLANRQWLRCWACEANKSNKIPFIFGL